MSYNLLDENNVFSLYEGIYFIQKFYLFYNKRKMEDTYSNKKYSIQMIEESIKSIINISEFYKIVIFDVLIGNSDRHHSNWALVSKKEKKNNFIRLWFEICPLYDNGSSLCAYEDSNNIEIFLKDKLKFEALVNTKSKSAIGWKNERPIRHFESLRVTFPDACIVTRTVIQ